MLRLIKISKQLRRIVAELGRTLDEGGCLLNLSRDTRCERLNATWRLNSASIRNMVVAHRVRGRGSAWSAGARLSRATAG